LKGKLVKIPVLDLAVWGQLWAVLG